ncbi:MAG: Amuc_1102 family pilus-like protein [Verrucomicrobiales bacterium]
MKIGNLNVGVVQSPRFSLEGGKKKSASKKVWLEAEVVFQVSSSKPPKDGYLPDALEVEIFVVVNAGREKKLITHKGTYANVAVGESQTVAVYLPPREFARLIGKDKPSKGDVVGYAVNITYAGKSVAADLKGIKKEAMDQSPEMEMVSRSKTPFRDLFYDSYLVDSEG